MKKVLIVGIDDYHHTPLKTCVNDAQAVSRSLERNEDGSPNFSIKALTNAEGRVDRHDLSRSLQQLFSGTADTVLFYFAGHGIITPEGSSTISLSFNQDKLLIGNQSGEISFHDIDTLELLDRHQISSDPVESIQEFEPNRLIAVFKSGAFGFYEKRNDELSFEWGNLSGELSSYAISSQHGLVAFGTRSGQLEIVDIDSRSNVQKLKIGSDEITSIDFSPDGTMIAAATDRLRVYIWDVKSGNKIQEFGQFDWFISKIKFSPSGQQLAIASGYNELNLWDISSNTVFSDYSHDLVTVDDISFSMKPGFLTSIHPGAIRHSPYFLSDEAMFNSAAAVIAKFASATPPDR